jgi:hypothetical protein
MLLAMATRRMERIADRQSYLGAIRIECDAAQLFDGSRGGHRLVQAKPLEHRVGPVEKPLVALRVSSRMVIGVLRRRNRQLNHVDHSTERPWRKKFEKKRGTTGDQQPRVKRSPHMMTRLDVALARWLLM